MKENEYQYRHLVRVIIENTSPLKIGSGEKSILTDSVVLRDVNGLPYIPGTTIAGLLRHSIEDTDLADDFFGSEEKGSKTIISEAKILDSNGNVLDGILDTEDSSFIKVYKELPIRQHVRIGHKGTAEDKGKFDEEIVLKGSRFCFEIEFLASKENDDTLKKFLDYINSDLFRIGANSRSGFGRIRVVKCSYAVVNLKAKDELEAYLQKSSDLRQDWDYYRPYNPQNSSHEGWTLYRISLSPVDFVNIGSGVGNERADMTFVRERFVEWNEDGKAIIKEQESNIVIPASSVKGALAHRVAFHYNRFEERFADSIDVKDIEKFIGKNNFAVKSLFGSEGVKDLNGKVVDKHRGNVLISDVIQTKNNASKSQILNHVAIDRFTGGAINGALFSEETLLAQSESFQFDIYVKNDMITENVRKAFEAALDDLCNGLLPLGGGTNRGNGCFEGKYDIIN